MPPSSSPVVIAGRVGRLGAQVEVEVALQQRDVEARRWAEPPQAAPTPVRANAVIDTGAEMTTIRPSVAQSLLLERPVRTVPLAGANTTREAPVFAVRLAVRSDAVMTASFDLLVVVAPLIDGPHDCLLGRDVLGFGELRWTGTESTFELELPGSS